MIASPDIRSLNDIIDRAGLEPWQVRIVGVI
jgi:hypothetical protein